MEKNKMSSKSLSSSRKGGAPEKSNKPATTDTRPSSKTTAVGTKAQRPSTGPSKHDQILALLRRKQGASLAEMQAISDWQPHSVRGFLSGTVKKRLKLKVTSVKGRDGVRRYAISAR
jgi:hypothetical protein